MKINRILIFPAVLFCQISFAQNVGIGTSTPSEKLEVNGTIKITDGTQGAGKVLTSDANGKGSWQTPSSGITLPFNASNSSNGISFGITNDNAGTAIYGYNMGGNGYAIKGFTTGGSTGRGVIGGTGPGGIGVEGYSLNNGTGGYFSSTSGLALKTGTGNVEMDGNVKIQGNLKIEGGNPGIGKVLTSDASGNATWSNAPVGFYVKTDDDQGIPNGGSSYTKVFFSTASGDQQGTSYSFANSQFTAPSTGFYKIESNLYFSNINYVPTTGNIFISILVNGISVNSTVFNRNSDNYGTHSVSGMVKLYSGDVVTIGVLNLSGSPINIYGSSIPLGYSCFNAYKVF